MAARCRQRLDQRKLPFKSNTQQKLELPQDRPIRRITMRFRLNVKTGATAGSSPKVNGYLNIIKHIQVLMNGTQQKFFIGGPAKRQHDYFKTGVYPVMSNVATIPGANANYDFYFTVSFDFAQNPSNLSDFSALLNAPALGSLDLLVDWGAIGDALSTVGNTTIDESKSGVDVSYVEVFDNGDSDGVNLGDALANAIDIRLVQETAHQIDKEYNSFGTNETYVDILPVPALILNHMIIAQKNITDGNPTNTNDVITHFSYENIRGRGEPIMSDRWETFHDTLKSDYNLNVAAPTGIGFIDWTDQRQGGLRNDAVDAIKLKLLTNAPATNKKNGTVLVVEFVPNAVPLRARV